VPNYTAVPIFDLYDRINLDDSLLQIISLLNDIKTGLLNVVVTNVQHVDKIDHVVLVDKLKELDSFVDVRIIDEFGLVPLPATVATGLLVSAYAAGPFPVTVSGLVDVTGSQVYVTNNPLVVTTIGTVDVTGSDVNVVNTPNVNVVNNPLPVSISGTIPISGDVNVINTPNVNVVNTPHVNVDGTVVVTGSVVAQNHLYAASTASSETFSWQPYMGLIPQNMGYWGFSRAHGISNPTGGGAIPIVLNSAAASTDLDPTTVDITNSQRPKSPVTAYSLSVTQVS